MAIQDGSSDEQKPEQTKTGVDNDVKESKLNPPERPNGKRPAKNAQELLLNEVRERALRSNPKLRAQLVGTIVISLKNSSQKFLFDWSTEDLKIEPTDLSTADCVILLREDHLLKIAAGDINPQIAMLSDKIKVEGRLDLAVYFFNLVAPGYSV